MKDKFKTILLYILFTIPVICLAICIFLDNSKVATLIDETATKWTGRQEMEMDNTEPGSIAIPGQTELFFKAGELLQKVNIYNPVENNCNIVFTLTVDGETIWKSGEVQPGYGFYEIQLNKELQTGEYEAELFHECFRNGTALNSAKMNVKIIVQEKDK